MQGADRRLVLLVVVVEFFCLGECEIWEEFEVAVDLDRSHIIRTQCPVAKTKEKERSRGDMAPCPDRRKCRDAMSTQEKRGSERHVKTRKGAVTATSLDRSKTREEIFKRDHPYQKTRERTPISPSIKRI